MPKENGPVAQICEVSVEKRLLPCDHARVPCRVRMMTWALMNSHFHFLLRLAVCDDQASPPLFEFIELLPREDILAHIS